MNIKQIIWLSEEIREAEVIVSDKNITCTVFAYPLKLKVNDTITEPLHIYNSKNIKICNNEHDCTIGLYKKNNYDLSYKIIAQVTDNNILKVGNFKFLLDDDIPNWINIGDYIELECSRIDLW